jgi:alpha-1,3-rhamnosyl/mannosyltransferase
VRVVVNGLLAAGSKSGIGHYVAQLLLHLRQQIGPGEQVSAFPQGWLRGAYSLGMSLRPLLGGRRQATAPGRPSWRQRLLSSARHCGQHVLERGFRALCRRSQANLYHEPNYIPLPCDLPTVVTIHDLSLLLYPQWHPADRVRHFEQHFHAGLRRCRHVLTVSEFCRQEVLSTLHLRPEQVTCTRNGVRADLRPLPAEQVRAGLRRLGLPAEYLLYLGNLEPRKNVLMLLRVYCSLPEELRRRFPLLLVGGWGWNTAEVARYLHEEAGPRGVLHLGYLADEHLVTVYNGARALLFPSFYEGFGLPPVEMLACGGAVLASTAGAVAETVGRQAHLIDPHDADAWRAALLRVLREDDWWHDLRRGAVEAARPYTWQRCAAETLQVYRSLTGAGLRQAG